MEAELVQHVKPEIASGWRGECAALLAGSGMSTGESAGHGVDRRPQIIASEMAGSRLWHQKRQHPRQHGAVQDHTTWQLDQQR